MLVRFSLINNIKLKLPRMFVHFAELMSPRPSTFHILGIKDYRAAVKKSRWILSEKGLVQEVDLIRGFRVSKIRRLIKETIVNA